MSSRVNQTHMVLFSLQVRCGMQEQSPEDTGKLVKGDSDYVVGASSDDDDDIYSDGKQEKARRPSQARPRGDA